MKKCLILTVMLANVLALSFALADADFTVDANGVITRYVGWDTEVAIPATISGKRITAIGKEAFRNADLTSVTIPEGVTSIGEYAFAENKLASVTIPGSVKTIRNNAFGNNTALAAIVLSEGVETIGAQAFGSTNCTSVSIPSTIVLIGDLFNGRIWVSAFDLTGKPSFTLAANINCDFYGLSSVIFYNYIANDRAAGTYALDMQCVSKRAEDHVYYETQYGAVLTQYTGSSTRVRVPAEIDGVAVKALHRTTSGYDSGGVYEKKSIAAVQIPEGITYIGNSAFSGNQLVSVTIPNSVTAIGERAFYNNQLTSVTIPNSVTAIRESAFHDNKLTSVTIGTGVTTIENYTFNNNKLTSITIPNSVTYIGIGAFSYNQLTSVTIGANVTLDDPFYYGLGYVYNNGGKAAGRYVYNSSRVTWVKE